MGLPLRRSARNIKNNLASPRRSYSHSNVKIRSSPSPKKDPVLAKKSRAPQNDKKDPVDKRAEALEKGKLKYLTTASPFPHFPHPTAQECAAVHGILASLHGPRLRPDVILAPRSHAGCGSSPSVLDALVRTILSQNTSDVNSSRARLGMTAVYGDDEAWEAVARGGQAKLQSAIQAGGLAAVKSRVIIDVLEQVRGRHGAYSLDHLFGASDEEAMRELLSFRGVGPKTASCVLMFCLRRESFAVDTHVYRITGALGWRPGKASREEAQAHLNATIPDQEKYGLHVLMVTHGKVCAECKAGGKDLGKCELRKAWSKVEGLG